ncbi:thioredoxin domain-containing protein [Propionicimonas sp.]|uniref:DsbA family protein n=1 Tax=Propionicimonas sp. TaxID=1955623 RepID=UPI0018419F50|nr:thioredoxin domain-containing protein [Propionicimonas sp.]MBU3977766.1 DsbA family protein [Actinomycetota bacterium]MBA3021689.1 disulfide bond formation protein DsbA [Propionicimonas sp.]MBU3987240.1 DsbA family protein [Actinomycetota bacterium]MBU4009061.1 DsbA family protein [Actinomycetota bacterium]MBU4065789.1 DsbA family protein [Actinomycetota bacterium]
MSKQEPTRQPSDPTSKRQQLRLEQERAAKEQRVRNIITYVAVGLGAIALIGGIIWAVLTYGSQATKPIAVKVNTEYTVMAGKADAPVIIDIYQDYICPYCGQTEQANSADLDALVASGEAAVRIHPMNFLDDASMGTKYSTRAANALVSVAKAEPDKMMAFNSALFANQPEENTTGLTDEEIALLATQVGVTQATIDTFASLTYADFVTSSTNAAFTDGIQSTPTVLINGTQFEGNLLTAGPLKAAVQAAAAK